MSFAPVNLTREDLRTTAWAHLIEDLQLRLLALREENDSFSDEITTAKRRGRIAELKEWIALAQQAQPRDAGPFGPASFQPYRAT